MSIEHRRGFSYGGAFVFFYSQDSRFVHSAPVKRFFSHKFVIYAIYFLVNKQYNIINLFNLEKYL